MAKEATGLTVFINGKIDSLNKALGDAEKNCKRSFGNIMKLADGLGTKFLGIGTAITVGLGAAVLKVANFADGISEASDRIGVGVEDLQKLNYAAEQTGSSAEDVEKAINKMSKGLLGFDEASDKVDAKQAAKAQKLQQNVVASQQAFTTASQKINADYHSRISAAYQAYIKVAQSGKATEQQIAQARQTYLQATAKAQVEANGKITDAQKKVLDAQQKLTAETGASAEISNAYGIALGRVGLKMDDVLKLSPRDKFLAIGDALSKVKDQTERTALAQTLLGKSGAKLLVMFKDGKHGAEAMGQELQDMGGVMSSDVVNATNQLSDHWSAMKNVLLVFTANLVKDLFPSIETFRTYLIDLAKRASAWIKNNQAMIAWLVPLIAKFGLLSLGIGTALKILGPFILGISKSVSVIKLLYSGITGMGPAFVKLSTWLAQGIGSKGGFTGFAGSIGAIVGVAGIGWAIGTWIDKTTENTAFGRWIDRQMDSLVKLVNKLKEWLGLSAKTPELGERSKQLEKDGKLPPLRDSGGPVTARSPYLIGMNGMPEIFVPSASGYVLDGHTTQRILSGRGGNGQQLAMPGGGSPINNTFNIKADSVNEGTARRLVELVGQGLRRRHA